MQISCPNCGSKSPIEAGSLMTQTRIVCADCAVEFAAELSDERPGVSPTVASTVAANERGIELFQETEWGKPAAVEVAPLAPAHGEVYEVLSLPEELVLPLEEVAAAGASDDDHANVLEDVFTVPAPPVQEQEAEIKVDAVEAYAAPAAAPDAIPERRYAEPAQPEPDADEIGETSCDSPAPSVPTYSDEPLLPAAAAAQGFGGYSLGVRLMRVSPLWLLVTGLSFISFIVFCNWFFVPVNVAQADTTRRASLKNQATNQSFAPVVTDPDDAPSRPDSPGSGQPAAAEAAVNEPVAKVEQPKPAPTQAPAPAPSVEPVAPAREEQPKRSAVAQPAPAGKFTVQVGSYNVSAEAESKAAALKAAGQAARVVEVELPKRGKWYRVYVGGFGSRDEAESHGRGLRGNGLAASYLATEAQ